jgi:transposase
MTEHSSAAMDVTIGMDLGDRQSELCVVDRAGVVVHRGRGATTAAGLTAACAPYAGAGVVLEVGTHSPWVSRLLQQQGHAVIVANPGQVRRMAGRHDKSDRIDAELLARLGRVDPQLLRPIQHRGEAAQRDRALLRVRDQLVQARTGLVVQARGLAKALGTRLPACDPDQFARRMATAAQRTVFPGMPEVCEAVALLTAQIQRLERAIATALRTRYPDSARVRQVTGVGPITTLAYVLTIEDPQRFRRSRDVGAYLGLRPKRYQSGRSDPALRISKAGDPFLRRMLVQSAQYILGPFGPDTTLRRFGLRLIARGGRAARKRAIVAVARKLAVLLHRLWISGAPYEPLRGSAPAAAA